MKKKEKKSIYIILMHTKTIPAKFVRTFTRYEYSHVAISLEKNCNISYSFGRRNPYSIIKSGFIVEKKNGRFFRRFKDTRCRIIELKISEKKYNKIQEILDTMVEHKKEFKYDYLGMIVNFFKIPTSFKNRYVCSSFVATLLKDAKVYDFDKKLCFVKPKDFAILEGSKEIYSGKFSSYNG